MANVRTAEDFGLDVSPERDRNPYEWMASALESDEQWANVEERDWFRSAQAIAEEQEFFHWKLEFPEVFYDTNGSLQDSAGYDAVIGNPLYIRIQSIRNRSSNLADFYTSQYRAATGNFDVYTLFTEHGYGLLNENGRLGYIDPINS